MYNTDSFGNVYFPAGVSVANYPITLNTPTHVLVAGAGGRISKVATSQLTSNTDVTSVFGRKGDVIAFPGDYTSEMIKEVRNLYFTIDRARSAISLTALGTSGPATYNPVTGIINVPQYQNEFNGVTTFNGRPGDVVLTALDVTTALTYTPLAVETDPIWTAQKPLYYTKVETQTYVTTQISNLIDSAPTTLDTLNELAAALGDDPNFATTITNLIATKEPAIAPGTTAQYWRGDKSFQTLNTLAVPELTNLYYTEARVNANTNVAANTAARHNAVSLGTANGLSLSTQQLSLGLASSSANGALSSTDWSTFNNKQAQLNGTGFVKAFGTSISYDNSTYYLASNPSGYITSASIGNGTLTLNVSGNGLSGSTSFTANQSGSTTFTVTSNASTSASANTLVYRDSAADIYTRYFFGSYINTSDNDESGITRFVIKNGDNYHRSATTTVAANIIRGVASGTWSIAITGNAGSITNQANSATITASTGVSANHIVQRDPNGYIFGNYINLTDDGNPGGGTAISSFITKQGDNYYRSVSPTNAMSSIRGVASGSWGIDITGSAANANALGGHAASTYIGKFGNVYYQVNTWLQFNGSHGLYWPNDNGCHIYPNNSTTYTQFRFDGVRNGYSGVYLADSGVNGMMYDINGNGGVYRESNGRWYWYHHIGNNCTGISTSSTSSSYRAYIGGSLYAEGDVVAYSDVRKKTDIVTIDNALEKVINLRGVYYTRIDDAARGRQTGVIAQEINEVLPEVVTYAADVDEYGVSYGNIVGVLIEAIKEQQTQIEELKNEIKELKNK